jgi:transcription initiation factor TFIID subunit 6
LAALAGNDNVNFKPLVKHVVSKELILFFDKIRSALLDEDQDPDVTILRESALESVRSDPGLHQLVPYFVHYAAEKITHGLHNIFILHQILRLIAAVIANKSLFVDPYVAALAPPVLTCLTGRNLGLEGSRSLEDQYKLRDLAASILGQLAGKYDNSSLQLRPRLTRTCLKLFLNPSASLGEHYGAINGLVAIGGPDAIRTLILPNIKPYEYVIQKAQSEKGPDDVGLMMIISALVKAVESIVSDSSSLVNGDAVNAEDTAMIEDYLGAIIGSRVVAKGNPSLNQAILQGKAKSL